MACLTDIAKGKRSANNNPIDLDSTSGGFVVSTNYILVLIFQCQVAYTKRRPRRLTCKICTFCSPVFSSLVVKRDTATDTSDTGTTVVNTEASFVYDCYNEEGWCDLSSSVATLDDTTFAGYLDESGQLTEESCSNLCTEQAGVYYDYLCSCDYTGPDSEGNHPVTCEYTVCAVEGRGHADIAKLTEATGHSELARYFVRAYHAEASSVGAFLHLRAELAHHNSPESLQYRCVKAAVEEVHHARMMAKLAGDEGCELPSLDFGEQTSRSLFELTLDNAAKGVYSNPFLLSKPNTKLDMQRMFDFVQQ